MNSNEMIGKNDKASMKTCVEQLAIFGGEPAFIEKLHVGRPNIGDRERILERVNSILDSGWLTNSGPMVQEFEQRIAELVGVEHCVLTCNATIALEIAIRALGMVGEVIVPSMTFVATAHALQWQEVTPVFCDIDLKTHNIDPSKIEASITPRTSGIIGVHLWGRPCDIEELQTIATKHNLKLLFDAAHAFGNSYNGKMLGSFGDAEVFSFHATKFLNSFEGGAVVTNNRELAEKIRLMTNFGFSGYDNVSYIGTNGKMSEVSAAMGLTSLEAMEFVMERNVQNYLSYKEEFHGTPGISLIEYDGNETVNHQYIVLEVDESLSGVSRDTLVEILWAENVIARRYFYPGCHNMEPYRSFYPFSKLLLENTEILSNKVLLLPSGCSIGNEEIEKICKIVKMVVNDSESVAMALKSYKQGLQ